jgi:RNA polymerase sigma-70 factor (ECF subfamily)
VRLNIEFANREITMTEEDYNQCVTAYADKIYRFCCKQSSNADLANDLTQEAFAKLWEKRKEVDSQKAKAYLFQTAYHKWIDDLRHSKFTTREQSNELVCQKVENSYSDLKTVLEKALERLPKVQKSVVLLRDYEGYSYEEIAKIVSLTEQQVKVYIFRARAAVKAYLGKIENII